MTEAEWLAATDPNSMLEFLRGKASDRKLRLFAVGCCQSFWDDLKSPAQRRKIRTAESYADGAIAEAKYLAVCPANAPTEPRHRRSLDDLLFFATNALGWPVIEQPNWDIDNNGNVVQKPWEPGEYVERRTLRASLLAADVLSTREVGPGVEAGTRRFKAARSREHASQAALLRCIFNPFRPVAIDPSWLTSTVLSLAHGIYAERAFDRLPILADALQDAGCEQEDILNHCRQPGEHVRGCWALDLVLARQ